MSTKLHCTEKQSPSVFPLVPCCDIVSSLTQVSVGCLSTGYFPQPVDVTWNSGSITTGIRNFPDVVTGKGTYISTSLLTISASDFKSNKYTCNVNHKETSTKINKDVTDVCQKAEVSEPTVEVVQASCGETGSVDLVCLVNGFSPEDIKIQWLLNGKATSIVPTNNSRFKDTEGKFHLRSQVAVPKDDWNSGDSYTCQANHPPSDTKNKDSIHKCSETSVFQPKTVILPPSPKDLLITKEAKLSCVVSKLLSAQNLNIKWRRSDSKRTQAFKSEPKQEFDGTFTVTSTLRISIADWEARKSFTCIVEDSDLPAPVEKTIQRRDEPVTEPQVYIFPPAAEELAQFEFVSLSCLIKRFSPKNLYVQWKKNSVVLDEDQYTNTEPILDEETDTYFMYSTILIEKSEWNRGAKYTCSCALGTITSAEIKISREYFIWESSGEEDEDSLWSTAATFITLFLLSFFYSATITIVKVKWFISRIIQLDKVDEHFVTVLDSVTP